MDKRLIKAVAIVGACSTAGVTVEETVIAMTKLGYDESYIKKLMPVIAEAMEELKSELGA